MSDLLWLHCCEMNIHAFQEMIPGNKYQKCRLFQLSCFLWTSFHWRFSNVVYYCGYVRSQFSWLTPACLLASLFQQLSLSPSLSFHSFLSGTVWMCPLHVSGEARWKGGEVSIALTRSARTRPSFDCTLASQPLLSPFSSVPCCDAMQTFLHTSWIRQTHRCLPFSWLSDC